jgi:hypothetical protein
MDNELKTDPSRASRQSDNSLSEASLTATPKQPAVDLNSLNEASIKLPEGVKLPTTSAALDNSPSQAKSQPTQETASLNLESTNSSSIFAPGITVFDRVMNWLVDRLQSFIKKLLSLLSPPTPRPKPAIQKAKVDQDRNDSTLASPELIEAVKRGDLSAVKALAPILDGPVVSSGDSDTNDKGDDDGEASSK